MFISALATTARKWKQSRHPSIRKWIMKMRYTYTMEYYSTTKKNEILNFVEKWMEIKKNILGVESNTDPEIQMPILSNWKFLAPNLHI